MANYLKKFTTLFFRPSAFFTSVAEEKTYWPVLLYVAAALAITNLVSTALGFPALLRSSGGVIAAIAFSFAGIFGGIVLAFVLPFIAAAIVHLGVLAVRGRQGFFNTFKPMAYSLLIAAWYNVVSAVLSLLLDVVFPINYTALDEADTLIKIVTAVPLPHWILGSILLFAYLAHSLYFQVAGVSFFQKLSALRAFAAVVAVPLVLAMILSAITFFFILIAAVIIGAVVGG